MVETKRRLPVNMHLWTQEEFDEFWKDSEEPPTPRDDKQYYHLVQQTIIAGGGVIRGLAKEQWSDADDKARFVACNAERIKRGDGDSLRRWHSSWIRGPHFYKPKRPRG